MAEVLNLKDYLDKKKVKYRSITHYPSYTAQEIAASAHIPGREMMKTVIVKLDGKLAMMVLPAHHNVNFDTLKQACGAKNISLATESEFQKAFPEIELGAMSPFGNLYDMDVYIENFWSDDNKISFNAGNHTELVRMTYKDYQKLAHPKVVNA